MKRSYKFYILITYYVVCVIIGILIVVFSTPICLEEQCVKKSAFMLSKMDPKGDPCKDFYQFMCGSARMMPPKGLNVTAVLNNTRDDPLYSESVFKYMVRKVSNYAGSTRTGAFSTTNTLYHESLLSKFFAMCERVEKTTDSATVEDFKSRLQITVDGTGMSLRDLLNPKKFNISRSAGSYEYRVRTAGFPGRHFFNAEIRRNHLDPSKVAMYIGKAISFQSITAADVAGKSKEDWVTLFTTIIPHYIPSAEPEDISKDLLKQVVDLLFDMKELVNTTENKKSEIEAVKVSELDKTFKDLKISDFLKEMGAKDEHLRIVYIEANSKNYFKRLKKVLKKYPRQVKVIYQLCQCILDVSPFIALDSYMSNLFSGMASMNSQSDLCKSMLGNRFGGMVLSMVIERFRLQRNPSDILDRVFSYFVHIMRSWLRKASWMDSKSRKGGIDKLDAMKAQISLSKKQYDSVKTSGRRSKFYNGLCMQRSILTTLLCMNRFFARKNFGLFNRELSGFDEADTISMGDIQYYQEKNTFQVPIFILRFPAFDDHWPIHINFGGLGVELSSELTTGFDIDGSDRDMFGIERSWWTNETYETYKKKEKYCSEIMRPFTTTPQTHPNTSAISSNLARSLLIKGELNKRYWKSVMGVKMAYKAHEAYMKTFSFRTKFLPGLEMYSREQNFFFSNAHMRCLPPEPPKELEMQAKIFFRALADLRVFKEAFKCSPRNRPNTKMAKIVSKASDPCTLFD